MNKIHRLPQELANQIAAGEVVERPASVVKELLENSLDAGARRISITIEYGGKRLIRVEDDGEGMAAPEAEIALERHATSKLTSAEDLGAIKTLGFRGEALPSIVSVSRLLLRTRESGTASGTEIKVSGGEIPVVKEVGVPKGTSIEVRDLFYNLPARRKFLKSDRAEAGQITRTVTQLSLAYPEVGFVLTSRGRRVLQCHPTDTYRDRFFQVYGDRSDLIEVSKEIAGMKLSGYISDLASEGPRRGLQNVFVNRRSVKDRTISHAILEAYRSAMLKERRPEVHLFLELASDRVDVNVHPTKAEVRFLEQSLVHETVRRTLSEALGDVQAPELQMKPSIARSAVTSKQSPMPSGVIPSTYPSPWSSVDASFVRPEKSEINIDIEGSDSGMVSHAVDVDSVITRPVVPLGQFRDTFILAVDSEGIVIIDQHVAHERILFEQQMEFLTQGKLESQALLQPILISMSVDQCSTVLAHMTDLERLGFQVEDFGGGSIRIIAVPAILALSESTATVQTLAEDLEGLDRGTRTEDALRKIAATTACHAAVKANDRLTPEKMSHIIEGLKRTAHSTVCPHGRPVMLRLTRREIERRFQRI